MSITALEKGTPLSEYWTEASALSSSGLGASPWYWETVYRTNGQTAYNAGRATEFARVQPAYLEFVGIEDGRQTTICHARSGTLLPSSHWFWKQNWPPLHYNCRSTVRAVSREEIELMREIDPKWMPTDEAKLAGESPPGGFGGNPISTGSFYKLTPKMIERAQKYGIIDDLKDLAKRLGLGDLPLVAPVEMTVEKVIEQATREGLFEGIEDPQLRALAQDTFKNATEKIRSIAAAHADDFTYHQALGGSFYNSIDGSITIGQQRTPYSFSHEFGHGIDHKVGSWYSIADDFKAAFKKDLNTLISPTSRRMTARGKEVTENMKKPSWNNNPPISDLFSGLTGGRIEGLWSHSSRYWSFSGMREKEVFANLFALRTSGDDALWSMVKEYVPSLCDAIDSFLGRQ
jgi:SPP1 gp7 family putative phage head morphogenesis protein